VSEEAQDYAHRAIVNVLGEDKVDPPLVTPGGDDFHFYTIKKPQLKATMVGLGCDLKPGLHHPDMEFEKDSLFNGIEILTEIVKLHSRKEG
jgi:amidohydrolase